MPIDMQQFNGVFFEEVIENLDTMESLLLTIDLDSPNIEELDAIFRAAHSIKGGAAIFGFEDMERVTHLFEDLLDRLRSQALLINSDMIDIFLRAVDLLKAQQQSHQTQSSPVDQARIEQVCQQLQAITQSAYPSKDTTDDLASAHYPDKNISFMTASDVTIEPLLAELALYGQLFSDSQQYDDFVHWQLTLSACQATDEQLLSCITFFAEPESVCIDDIQQDADDIDTTADDVSFGFFDDADVNTTVDDVSFGFFDDDDDEYSTETSDYQRDNEVVEPQSAQQTTHVEASPSTTIRVDTEKLDQLINQVGELVINHSMIQQASHQLDASEHLTLLDRIAQLERTTEQLQRSVMAMRMMPLQVVFRRFPRLVRDLANQLDKRINLRLLGEETELDKGLIEQLADPLTHLIRNSIDHGIESPPQRLVAGKPEMGTITLQALYSGGSVLITVNDDGAGLNRDKILQLAAQRGVDVNDNMSDHDVYQLIFAPGFSTAEHVTALSGRGVGMDVVKRNIQALGGAVSIDSQAGIGSTVSIHLPLTLAIVDGMFISVAGQMYIIPLTFIVESMQPSVQDIKTINGKGTVVKVRGEYIPLVALHRLFNIEQAIQDPNEGIIVLLESNHRRIALLVDQLEGQHKAVLKSLQSHFRRIPLIFGATIMGDGTVALILDVAAIISDSD